MASNTSRYSDSQKAFLNTSGADGRPRSVAYLRRRFLPPLDTTTLDNGAEGAPSLAESGLQITGLGQTLRAHVIDARDRLDLLAWLSMGDPLLYWRIADCNSCLFPDELTAELGTCIVVPEGAGRSLTSN